MKKRIKNKKLKRRKVKTLKKTKKKSFSFKKYIIPFFLLVVIAVSVFFWWRKRNDVIYENYSSFELLHAPGDRTYSDIFLTEEDSFNILVLGLDKQSGGHIKADAVFIVHYDSLTRNFQTFELPSKAKYYNPADNTYYQLDNSYAVGQLESPEYGLSFLSEILEYNLALTIDAYFATDILGFRDYSQELGNINVQNEQSINDLDLEKSSERYIFDSGNLNLNSMDLVSFVKTDEDGYISKSIRHYSVILELLNVLDKRMVQRFIGSYNDLESHFYSNLTGDSIRLFIDLLCENSSINFNFYELNSVLSQQEEGEVFDTYKFDNFVATTFEDSKIVREQARIEIYNSTQISGLASRYTRVLNNLGCDVIRKSNTDIDVQKTIIFVSDSESFTETINQMKKAFPFDVEVVYDAPPFVTTGDIILILSEDLDFV